MSGRPCSRLTSTRRKISQLFFPWLRFLHNILQSIVSRNLSDSQGWSRQKIDQNDCRTVFFQNVVCNQEDPYSFVLTRPRQVASQIHGNLRIMISQDLHNYRSWSNPLEIFINWLSSSLSSEGSSRKVSWHSSSKEAVRFFRSFKVFSVQYTFIPRPYT